jgi:hypothetical protein
LPPHKDENASSRTRLFWRAWMSVSAPEQRRANRGADDAENKRSHDVFLCGLQKKTAAEAAVA